MCEPAQSLIHRADIVRDGTRLRLERVKGEEQSEFLASRDSWFHPMSLARTPDGSMAICDFYREIIEDYSAIPRHLQQQYGVTHGNDRGRIWILEAKEPYAPPKLSAAEALVLQLRKEDDKPLDAATRALSLKQELEPNLALQLALSVGADKEALIALARNHGHSEAHQP